jgi:hypothetical protein
VQVLNSTLQAHDEDNARTALEHLIEIAEVCCARLLERACRRTHISKCKVGARTLCTYLCACIASTYTT